MKRLSKALFRSVKSNPALFIIVCASLERRYLPCCGPGCITPMEPGEE